MPKTKAKPKSPPIPRPSPEERQANRDAVTRLAWLFMLQHEKRRRRIRLVVLREPLLATSGVCVGSTLEALARLYPGCEVIGVGVDAAALQARWPAASVKQVESLPPPSPGDRWVYYDPSALEGQGGWRLVRPTIGS